MKLYKHLLSLSVLILIVGFSACDDDDGNEPSLSDLQLQALQGTWSVNQDSDVTFEGDNAPGDWSDFNITFTSNRSITVQNLPTDVDIDIFQLSSFEIEGSQELSFDLIFNGLTNERANVQITGNTLNLTFFLSSNDDQLGLRSSVVQGGWEFLLNRD